MNPLTISIGRNRTFRTLLILAAALPSVLPSVAPGAQIAETRIFCLSLRFQQGTTEDGNFTLAFSTLEDFTPNGELAPTFDNPTHISGFILDGAIFIEPIFGTIVFDVPPFEDANQNGFPDFFEVSQAASGVTDGAYAAGFADDGSVQATWSRAAGSKDGVCVLRLTSSQFGALGNFTHAFELLEYSGPLNYTPGTNEVTGDVRLTQTGAEANRLEGPIAFVKSPADPFEELELQAGAWTNAMEQTLSYFDGVFTRDPLAPTNYFGFLDFVDGNLNTSGEDYFTWILSIDDPNDNDQDGIPDFSDHPESVPAREPSVTLAVNNGSLSFTISGTIGRLHELQETASLSQPDWTTASSLTLASDPDTLFLPAPANGHRFWRVRVP